MLNEAKSYFFAGSAKPPPALTLTSLLEGGLEVVVATAVHAPLRRGSGRMRHHENCCRRANVHGSCRSWKNLMLLASWGCTALM
jgi:hypothetical protein